MSFGGVNTLQQYSNDFGLGHNGVKISLNYFDGIPEPSLLNALESNELKLIFKSLLKRDETTKERACTDLLKLLQDFENNEYFFDSDIFTLCWSQVYAKLLMSESKNIRSQSHQITTSLIRLLNKRIAKFLKDLIPLLLMGTCDTDASVSKSCKSYVSQSFNNDPQKIHTLWKVFHEQILQLVREAVVIENEGTLSDERYVNKENSQLRYHRLMTSAVCLLNQLIKLNSDTMDEHKSTYRAIFKEERLWKLFNLKDTHNLKTYTAVLELLRTLYSVGYMGAHKETFKLASKPFFKSLAQVSTRNVLKVSPIVPAIVKVLTDLDCYKDGRIWSYEKNSLENLQSFLAVTSTATSPGYYNAIFDLYERTSAHELLDYENDWFPIWRKSVESLNGKLVLGRFGGECLAECWTCYQKFTQKGQIDQDLVSSDVLSTLNNGRSLSRLPDLNRALSNALPAEFLVSKIKEIITSSQEQKGKPHYLENLLELLSETSNNESALHDLFEFLFNSLSNESENFTEQRMEELKIYRFFINTKLLFLTDEISKFIYELPAWIDEKSYDLLSSIVVDFSNSVFFQKTEDPVTLLEDFFLASSNVNVSKKQIATVLAKINGDAFQKISNTDYVKNFVQGYIESYQFDDNGDLFKSRLVTKETIVPFYVSAQQGRKLAEFCNHLSHLDPETRRILFEHTDILPSSLFTLSKETSQKLFDIVLPYAKENDRVAEAIARALVEHVSQKLSDQSESECLHYAVTLLEANSSVIHILSPRDKFKLFGNALPFIDYRFALVNGLQLNMHLLDLSSNQLELSKLERFINYCFFLDSLLQRISVSVSDEDLVFCSMVSELAGDFNCISSKPNDSFYDFKNTLFKAGATFDFARMVEQLIGKTTNEESKIISTLKSESTYPSVTLYKYRILHKILLNEVELISQASFNNCVRPIELFVTSVVRSKDENASAYFLASIILSSLQKFANSEPLSKLRTVLASECIGTGATDVIKKTHKSIILLDNLLNFETNSTEGVVPIAGQRMNMVLNSVSKWLDSDLAYEQEFSNTRLSLLKFATSLLKFPAVKDQLSMIFEISARLLTDSLSMCQLDETPFLLELRLYSVNLYLQLSKFDKTLWSSENVEEMNSSLIELSFLEYAGEENNQVSSVFYRTFDKALGTLPLKSLAPYFDQFFESILNTDNERFINRLRLQVHFLTQLIFEKQQEAVIEYEFSRQQQDKSKDDDNEEDTAYQKSFEIPQNLLSKLNDEIPEDYLEYENQYGFLKYLWYWGITLSYFHELSYNLRQLYIDQLKKQDLLTKVLDFLADQIDLQDTKFWTDAGSQVILDYDITENGFSPYKHDIFIECKQLLGHFMYDIFNNIGSLSSSWWLNIKDKSLQLKIEKFVSQFISPISINHELEDVETKIERLAAKDDSLTIRINKVTNEVKASYLIDEQKLELSFRLPSHYPLTNVQVIGVSRVGISEQKWKQWIMSTQRVITGMNGSVADSLELFTKNVNLQFSGFEECAICYSILHAVDRKLPTKTCPTCNNKFHGSCLYKWFRSSGNNTCPLCRGEIPFRR
ncbi:hypothetical protein ZYGR_0AS05560 [Zygosaccharomyces rouxii]|uniref:E3 ubiquitin-protein ligase listerin n=1 Tax=Zygosaccharomyces rouxii TaxID=4956 RepID=A0A1Q3AHX4_ZYGRO|nr:hypothetical protein ZYGR_0AS05560 [Zygosaccharomyces rouxii]